MTPEKQPSKNLFNKKNTSGVITALLISCANPTTNPSEITFTPTVQNNLSFLYDHITNKHPRTEFVYCGYGITVNDTTTVTHGTLPYISDATSTSVRFVPCEEDGLVAIIHSHTNPFECELSPLDLSFIRSYVTNAQWYSLVCSDRLVRSWNKQKIVEAYNKESLVNTTTQKK